LNKDIIELIPRLRIYARALTRDYDRAEDLLQDSLERAYSRFHYFKKGSNLKSWLFTIMHNLNANDARKYNNGPEFVSVEQDGELPSWDSSGDDGIEISDLYQALSALSDQQREIIVLVCLEDMSYKEVARVLDIPEGTVMSRLYRARENLRAIMTENSTLKLRRVK
jgi:RNA polymerase sigma-70 factor (ECF subfamily)